MATISTSGIAVGQIIRSEHLLRVINALNGVTPIDIIITGSLSTSGSLNVTGSTFLKGLPNTSRANVITYDPTTGQLSYLASASLGVTMSVSQPGGSDTQVQYNSGSVLAGNSAFRFIYNSSSLTLGTSTPTGLYSFTQGSNLTASGNFSHAQGSNTKATNTSAHAEGDSTLASGIGSHAEGNSNTSSGNYSHAEGDTAYAIGPSSHAEGQNTQALGVASHAEGLGTVASGSYQHTQGQYNILSSAQSAFIIGNGTADNARSNLVFASGSQFQVSGSLDVKGSGNFTSNLTVTGSTTITSNSPSLLLIRGNGDSSILFNTGNTVAGFSGSLYYFGSQFFEIGANTSLKLSTNSKERITIENNGGIIINSGSQATAPTVLQVTGSSSFTGSVTISDILTITPRTTTPTGVASGSFIVSGSGVTIKPYFWDGSAWNALY
jgi:hypothetical protein